ncbi:hypothetical protein FUAX_31840 [Fulvitalea axinellae]|uniref:DUF349 domain-containing protein n=1 Tax=Fulvitalea axinellae TaxID=1182444 RepID=A0AAU9CRZ0_9BACT|nr:hypothetical protein FUAX_31840 [Fulvitalea axinellae]
MESNEYGYIKDGKVFLKGFLEFPDREIGEVKEDEASSLKYFEDRFEIAQNKVDELAKAIEEATNKGSYLMKLVHLRKYLAEFDAIGDFVPLFESLGRYEVQIQEIILKNRVKNLEIKRALLAEAELIVAMDDMREASEKFKDLNLRWLKTGAVGEESREEVEGVFEKMRSEFYEKKSNLYAERQQLVEASIKEYEKLVEEAEGLGTTEDIEAAAEKLKTLQKQWKELGSIPAKVRTALWSRFRKANDDVFNKLKSLRKENRSKKAGVLRAELVEKAEAFMANEDATPEAIKRLVGDWKRLPKGGASKELADRFFYATDWVNERLFVEKLATAKFKGFKDKDETEQNKIRLRIVRDLLQRDMRELEVFKENMEKFHANSGAFNSIVSGKEEIKTRKVQVKKKLMEHFQQKSKS